MATDFGQGTGSAELFLGYPPTAAVEAHVGNPPSYSLGQSASGVNPLPPSSAPNTDPSIAPFSAGAALTSINKSLAFGTTGASLVIANPA